MMRKKQGLAIVGLFLLLVVLALPCQAAQETPVAYIQIAEGDVEIEHPDGIIDDAEYDSPLLRKDVVRTGSDGSAQIMFLDKTVLALASNSEVGIYDTFTPEKTGTFDMKLMVGTARILSSALLSANPEKFKAATPLGTIGIRGTELGLSASADSEVVMLIEGGPVFYTDTQNGGLLTGADKAKACTELEDAMKKSKKALQELSFGITNIGFITKVKKQIAEIEQYQAEFKCSP